jgi:tetratricopeptide (TPR) repeat protein
LTRHQLKQQDELSARMTAGMDYVISHKKSITATILVATVAAAVVAGAAWFLRSRQVRAAAAFNQALITYHAPVLPVALPDTSILAFKTSQEKYQKALGEFTEVSNRYSHYAAGDMARYYAALCQRELGNHAEAEKQLQAVAGDAEAELASQAKLALAQLYEQTSRPAEAEKIYQELEANPTEVVPKPVAQLARANVLLLTNPAQAAALYDQIQKEHQGTAAAEYAAAMLQQAPR